MRSLPSHVTAVMDALSFSHARRDALRAMTDSEWKQILSHWGFVRLTLPLRQRCSDDLPQWVREQIDQNIDDNTERFTRIQTAYREIGNALDHSGVEHVVLKGFAQWPAHMQGPHLRAQSDIDLYCPSESILRARDALQGLGYESAQGKEHQDSDHLPEMVRKSDWQWRGRPFDPDNPAGVDLHFRFWTKSLTRLDPKGLDEFWGRRVRTATRRLSLSRAASSRQPGLRWSARCCGICCSVACFRITSTSLPGS